MKLYIKTPYPGESTEDAPWHECTTWYEVNVMWPKHNKAAQWKRVPDWVLPTKEE